MFKIPDNPYKHHPERKQTVKTRVICGVAGALLSIGSLSLVPHLEPLSAERDYLILTTLLGGVMFACTISAELQERFGRNDGGDGWWRNGDWPVSPVDPTGPRGISIADEAEAYLMGLQEPISV